VPLEDLLLSRGILSREKLEEVTRELEGTKSPVPSSAGPPTPAASPAPRPTGPPTSSFIPKLGKYTLIRELGRGGMGAVYEALDTQLNRKVALKLMLTNPHADPQDLALEEERFVREAKMAARLKHSNIVPVYEAGVIDGRRFLAMELIEGKAFSAWRKQGSPTVRQQVAVLRDVAQAVHYAHEQGILHRDLKPRNILVDASARPFVTDFGLAKSIGKEKEVSLTASGMVVGTPTYMSPEQCQGTGRIDWRSDIWSLGVMLYEVLAGRPPFEGESPMEIMTKVVRDPVVPPSKVAVETALALDGTIENICLKALAKDPKDRYPTARALAEDLSKWIEGQAVKVTSPKRRGISRKTLLKAAGLAALLAAAGIAYWATRPPIGERLARARSLLDQGDLKGAETLYIETLALAPDHKAARAGLDEVRARLAQREARLKEEYRAEIEKLTLMRQNLENLLRKEREAETEDERRRIADQRAAEERRLKETEKAAADIAKGVAATAPMIPPNPFPENAEERSWRLAVDLLPPVQPARDALWGRWARRGDHLQSDATPYARLEVPYELPEEYNIRLTFRRLTGADAVALILSHKGASFVLEMGADRNRLITLVPPEARDAAGAPAARRPLCLENKVRHETFVRVRRDGVQAALDGVPVLEWNGDPSRLGIGASWRLREGRTLGVGSHASPTAFEKLEILEIRGAGRRLAPLPPPHFQALPVDPESLRPGLLGEYCHGMAFELPALRRIDPAIAFQWGEGPAWPNGPANSFSIRWSGYLLVPRPGEIPLVLTAEGAARLLIHGRQVLSVDSDRRGIPQSSVCRFDPGLHPLTLEFLECGFLAGVQLSWIEREGLSAAPIGRDFLFHDPATFRPTDAGRHGLVGALPEHPNTINGISFSPDGRLLASACDDGHLRIWETGSRRLVGTLAGHSAAAQATAFSPDGRLLASGGFDRKIKLWEPAGRPEPRTLSGHQGGVRCLAFSPDGRKIASGSYDRTILLWDTTTGRQIRMIGTHGAPCLALAFSPDGRGLASAGEDRLVRLWRLDPPAAGRPLEGHADAVRSLAFSPDGTLLASAGGDHTIRIWDVGNGNEIRELTGHRGEVTAVAFHPGGRILASGGRDATIRIWDAGSGREKRILPGHAGEVTCLSFDPEGKVLASGGTDRTVRLWEIGAAGD